MLERTTQRQNGKIRTAVRKVSATAPQLVPAIRIVKQPVMLVCCVVTVKKKRYVNYCTEIG